MRSGDRQSSPIASADMRVTIGSDVYASVDIGGETARLIRAYEDEQVWGGVYHFWIDNADEALNAKDYKGDGVVVSHGFVNGTRSNIGDLWVDNQEFISVEGKLLLHLTCIDAWGLLSKVKGTVGGTYWNYPWQKESVLGELALPVSGESLPATLIAAITAHYDKPVWYIVAQTISDALNMTVDIDDNDGFINTEKPQVSSVDARNVVIQAMQVTESYLLWKADGKFHIVQPGAHGVTYFYNTANLHYSSVSAESVTTPNRVIYWFINKVDPNDADTWLWAHSDYDNGVGVDTDSYGVLGIYIDEHHNLEQEAWEGIASQAEADARAAARMLHIQLSKATGIIVAPMHCSQELFDKITVIDPRYGTPKTITGYVFRIIREYDRGVYRITMHLGGVETGYTSPGGEVVRTTPVVTVAPPSPAAAASFLPAYLPVVIDAEFTADDYDDISWTSGTITCAEGTEYSFNSGSLHLANSDFYYLYYTVGDSSLNNTQTFANAISSTRILIAIVLRAPETNQKAMIVPAKGGRSLSVNGDNISAYAITASKIAVTELAAITANMGLLNAGEIRLGTFEDGHANDIEYFTGWRLWVEGGIGRMAGYYYDTYPSTIQWYSGSDGKLYAGGGATRLDFAGITIKGNFLRFEDIDGVLRGNIYALVDRVALVTGEGIDIHLTPGAGASVIIAEGLVIPSEA